MRQLYRFTSVRNPRAPGRDLRWLYFLLIAGSVVAVLLLAINAPMDHFPGLGELLGNPSYLP